MSVYEFRQRLQTSAVKSGNGDSICELVYLQYSHVGKTLLVF